MKHIGAAISEAIGSIPAPKPVKDQARDSAVMGRAYEIATYSPVTDWAALIAESEPDMREAVRECLADMYRRRQRDEALRARVDSGIDVVMNIRCGEAL